MSTKALGRITGRGRADREGAERESVGRGGSQWVGEGVSGSGRESVGRGGAERGRGRARVGTVGGGRREAGREGRLGREALGAKNIISNAG